MDTTAQKSLTRGIVERVAIGGSSIKHSYNSRTIKIGYECPDHNTAIKLILNTLVHPEYGVIEDIKSIAAVGHRVVHGGEQFYQSTKITSQLLQQIKSISPLAPLHNPPNIEGIIAAQSVLPQIPHVAVFDTAFHQTMPPRAYIYPLPYEWYSNFGIRRYGFHGTSHLYVSKRAAVLLKRPIEQLKIVTLHIGNGASSCAVESGVSIDTSMGFTPLEGAVMGTRCGDIDPAIPLYIMQHQPLSPEEMDAILNKKSGLLGITGNYTDRRDVIQQALAGNKRCQLAMEIEAYRLKKYIGAYAAAMSGLDIIVFTAGVGENSPHLRRMALEGLEFLGVNLDKKRNQQAVGGIKEEEISTEDSAVKVFIIPTDEERVIVEDTLAILTGTYDEHIRFPYSFAT